jgi:hypothetical protein
VTAARTTAPLRFRLLGLVPLAIYLAHFRYNWSLGNPGNGLWMCHVSNLSLAFGLMLAQPVLIRLAVLWIIPGIPLWIMDMMRTGQMPAVTFFSHIGGLAVGLVALARVRGDRWAWLYGIGCYLVVQHLCRLVTRPELNVNVAHTMYYGWDRFFSSYWQYWVFTTATATAILWAVNQALYRLVPPVKVNAAEGRGTE